MYQRSVDNTTWETLDILPNKVVMPAAATSDYVTPTGIVSSSETQTADSFETDPGVDMNGWTYSELDTNGALALQRGTGFVKDGSYNWQLVRTGVIAVGDWQKIVKSFDLTGKSSLKIWTSITGADGRITLSISVGGTQKYSSNTIGDVEVNIDVSLDTGLNDVEIKVTHNADPSSGAGAYFDFLRLDDEVTHLDDDAIDDDTATYWQSKSEATPYIYVDCGALKLLSGCRIYWNTNGRPTGFDIDVSEDATTWEEAKSETTQPAAGWVEYSFNTRYARYIRIQGDGTLQMEVAEVDYYSKISDRIIAEHGHGDQT